MAHGQRPPKGVTERGSQSAGFGDQFRSTILGTALFVAEMQRKVPPRTKVAVLVLVLVAGGLGAWAWIGHRSTEEARVALSAALRRPPNEGVPIVRSLLASGLDADLSVQAVEYLGDARDPESVPMLAVQLDGPPDVARAAAEALARIGSPSADSARAALSDALSQADPTLVIPVAWALAVLGDARGLEVSVEGLAKGSLQSLRSYDARELANLLGTRGLTERLSHPHEGVRTFAARWLGYDCGDGVVSALSGAMGDSARSVVIAACVSLTRCDGEAARELVPSALHEHPDMRVPLTAAFLNDVGAPGLGILLATSEDVEQRRDLVRRMMEMHDPRAADELMAELDRTSLDESRYRRELVMGLAEVSDPRTPIAVEAMLEEPNSPEARAAIEVLGQSGLRLDAEPLLTEAYKVHRKLRAHIIEAMGQVGACSDEAREIMRDGLRTPATLAPSLKALGRCGDEEAGTRALRELERIEPREMPSPAEARVRRAAYDALARVGTPEAVEVLLATASEPKDDRSLRLAAADALGATAHEPSLERALDVALDRATGPAVRSALFRALRHHPPEEALPRFMGYIRGGEDNERTLGAALVVGEAMSPRLGKELVALLDDERARQIAAFAVAWGGNEDGARRLVQLMADHADLDAFVRRQVKDASLLLSPRDFESGRIYRRIAHLLRLRELGVGGLWEEYGARLKEGSVHAGGMSGREIRRRFTADFLGEDSEHRRLGAEALLAMGARGVLLSALAREDVGAEEAKRVLTR